MTLQQQLDEATTALHNLMIGRNVVEVVDQNGERVRYTSANKSDLQSYINDLRRQIGNTSVGPMTFWGHE